MEPSKPKVLLCCTGSVATIKAQELVESIGQFAEVQTVVTKAGEHFIKTQDLNVKYYREEDEWEAWQKRGDKVLHIELRKWADILVIAPLDANTLAKIANGITDNLLVISPRPPCKTQLKRTPRADFHISGMEFP